MATGIVRGLVGSVTVTDTRGVTRQLRTGDTVELNDTVQAASGSTVHIAFDNGNFATVGSNEKLVLDTSVIDPMAESDNKAATDLSVADIQAMIAAGADPTEIAEATAAGADAGTRGDPDHSGSHSFVVVNQDAARGEVTPGFETGTFSNPLTDTENVDGRLDTFLLDPDPIPDTSPDPIPEPENPPSNHNPVISDEGQGLFVKESGVGTIDQGGKPGWAIGDHNHAIAGKPVDEGSFRVVDADGDTLTATLLDKDGVPMKGVVTDDSGTMTVQTEYGTLTVTPTEGADGSVTYTYHYELDNKLADSLNEGDDPVHEHFQIEVSDSHGGMVTQPVDITIEGTNDAPTFNGRGQNIQLKEEGVYNGNQETTDDHKDNGFVFEKNDRPKVQGDLSTFVTDADKGADLTYTVDHFNVKNTSVDSVETTLFTGNNTPVIDDQTGEAVIISVEMVGKPTIDASGIQTVHTNYGVLTIDTKTGHYTFELGGSEEADKLVNSMAAGEKFTFQFETLVTDQFGAIGKHVLNVVIEGANDIPTLTVDKVTLDVTEQGENVSPDYIGTDSGNAQGTDVDRGADLHYSLIDENGKETTSIKTEYGTLSIDADGKYHFTIDNTSESVKALGEGDTRSAGSFTIRVTDEHGAYTEQQIEVNVHGAKDAPLVSDHLVVNEHGLDNAFDASESALIKAPDGYAIVGVEDGKHGTVSQDADGNWHYTLSGAIDSGNNPGVNTVTDADTVKMVVQDAHGNQFTVDVKVDIIDDVPVLDLAGQGYQNIHVGSGASVSEAAGSINYDFGADDGAGKSLTITVGERSYDVTGIAQAGSCELTGEYGKLTIFADGSYHYQANPDIYGNAQDSFVITITDADGDRKNVKLDVTVTPPSGPGTDSIAHVVVDEAGLNDADNTSEISKPVTMPDGYTIVDSDTGYRGNHGTLAMDADGNWHYTLNEAIDSGKKQGTNTVEGADTVKVTVQDTHGNQFTVDVRVDIIDDIPVVNTTYGVGMQDMVNATDGVDHFKAGFDFDFGADKGEGKSVEVSIDGQVVTLHHTEGSIGGNHQTLSSLEVNDKTGEVSYEQNSEVVNTAFGTQGQAHDITVSVTDSDGDVVSQTVHLETVGMQVGGVHSDTITGGSGTDIIIGDKGHIDGVQNTVTYNLSLVLDVSNSMYAMLDNGNTRLASSVEALGNLIDSIAAQTAQGGMTVNIQLVGFHSSAFQHSWLSVTQDNVNELKNYVNELAGHIRDGGASNTNYQAAFGEICEWFGKLSDVSSAQGTDVVNKVYFISDGVPNSLTINGAIVDYGSLHQQPDWPASWPHDSYAPDYFIYARDYVLSHTDGYATLLNQVPGLEMNSAGFAGSGLDAGTLDHFDNTGGGQILHNSHDLTEFLKPGVVVPPVDADRDTVYAGAGNDIVFGDHVHFVAKDGTGLDGQSALIAAVSAAGGDTSSNASIHQFLTAHPELADTLADPNRASNQNDLLVGGTGHDILVGQGGNDLLIGDGDNSVTHKGSLDHIDYLLDSHAQGDDLASGIHHLFDHGTAQEISHFTSGIENMDVESSHDGNDHLYGGTGNDVLVGMGGNDHLYGGEGHDILLGGSGNDVLVGGKGDDILSGGTGNDIFKYTVGDLDVVTQGDTITDFHLGNLNESKGPLDVNADVLDISELITGHDKPTSLESLVNGGYLSFDDVQKNDDGTLTVKLSIDVDGQDGSAHMTNLATITMSGFEHHGGTDIVQDLMNQLVNNENIKF